MVRLRARVRCRRPAPPGPAHVPRLHGADVPRDRLARGRADRAAPIAVGDAVRRPRGRPRTVGRHPLRLDLRVPLRGAVRPSDRRAALPVAAPRRHRLAGRGVTA